MQGIYQLKFKDGSTYIGQSINIRNRFNQHFGEMEAGEHKNINVQTKFNIYGAPIFEVLEIVENVEDLNKAELDNIGRVYKGELLNIQGNPQPQQTGTEGAELLELRQLVGRIIEPALNTTITHIHNISEELYEAENTTKLRELHDKLECKCAHLGVIIKIADKV